mgnify:CR=1 FL=1
MKFDPDRLRSAPRRTRSVTRWRPWLGVGFAFVAVLAPARAHAQDRDEGEAQEPAQEPAPDQDRDQEGEVIIIDSRSEKPLGNAVGPAHRSQ